MSKPFLSGKEEDMNLRNESLSKLSALSSDLFCVASYDGYFLEVNDSWTKLLGYSEAELKNSPLIDFVHNDDKQKSIEVYEDLRKNHKSLTGFVNRCMTKENACRYLTWSVMPDPESRLFYAVARDDTDKIIAEKAMQASHKKYLELFEESHDIVYFANADGYLLEINNAGLRLSGYEKKEELFGRKIEDLFVDKADRHRIYRQLKEKGKVSEFGVKLKDKNEKEHSLILSATAIFDANGSFVGHRGIAYDITEKEELLKQVQHMQKMEAMGILAGGIAHDFNNILGVITGYAEMAMLTSKDEKISGYTDQILVAGKRAKDLVQRILAFSRSHTREFKAFSLKNHLNDSVKFCRSAFPKSVAIDTQFPDEEINIFGDESELQNVFLNLFTNSLHAMEGKTDARLLVQMVRPSNNGRVEVSVKDNGHGMSREIVGKIFEPYFTTKPKGAGTGLGLSMVHSIIKNHNGYIQVDSEPGIGTEFKITLPVYHAGVIEDENIQKAFKRGSGSILIVDDEEHLLGIQKEMLEHIGYRADVCGPAEILMQMENNKYDLVITDLDMPGKSGLELAQYVTDYYPDTHLILCTGHLGLNEVNKLKKSSAKKILNKPVSMMDLSVAVYETLQGK